MFNHISCRLTKKTVPSFKQQFIRSRLHKQVLCFLHYLLFLLSIILEKEGLFYHEPRDQSVSLCKQFYSKFVQSPFLSRWWLLYLQNMSDSKEFMFRQEIFFQCGLAINSVKNVSDTLDLIKH